LCRQVWLVEVAIYRFGISVLESWQRGIHRRAVAACRTEEEEVAYQIRIPAENEVKFRAGLSEIVEEEPIRGTRNMPADEGKVFFIVAEYAWPLRKEITELARVHGGTLDAI